MEKSDLLILKNIVKSASRLRPQGKQYLYKTSARCDQIDLVEIGRVLHFICNIARCHSLQLIPITIDLGDHAFFDKLSYIILESLMDTIIVQKNAKIEVRFNCPHNIFNEGIHDSCLRRCTFARDTKEFFKRNYSSKLSLAHFRRVISKNSSYETVSFVQQDIESFLKTHRINNDNREAVANVVAELVDNALDHGNEECLVDLDVTNEYFKRDQVASDNLYKGVNIVVLNYSQTLLGDRLENKLCFDNTLVKSSSRYREVLSAKDFHLSHLTDYYCEKDFYSIASFQDHISGRINTCTGGTGLTALIKALEANSDSYFCYCISGPRIIRFLNDYISYSPDGWIGFNKSNDFIHGIPDEECITAAPFYFPGTAYNLNFVLKQEEG